MKSNSLRRIVCVGVLSTVLLQTASSALEIGGYFENWAQYRGANSDRSNIGVFPSCVPAGFEPVANGLSVFNYAFAFFNYDYLVTPAVVTNNWYVYLSDPHDVEAGSNMSAGLLVEAANLKATNANLKVMLSIGGWNFCQANAGSYSNDTYTFFHELLKTETYQLALIDSLTNPSTGWFMQKTSLGHYLIDGVDFDFEYPGQATGPSITDPETDYQGFINFVGFLRNAIDSLNQKKARPPVYFSITLPPFLPHAVANGSWDGGNYPPGIQAADGHTSYSPGQVKCSIPNTPDNPSTYFAWLSIVANYCDWVNLMTYDMYGAFNGQTGVQYQAPLYNGYRAPYDFTTLPDNSQNQAYSIDYAVQMWTTGVRQSNYTGVGIPASKINLGVPAYGRSYGSATQAFPTKNPIGAKWTEPGVAQKYTQTPGVAAYFELEPLIKQAQAFSNAFNFTSALTSVGPNPIPATPNGPAQSFLVFNNSSATPSNNVFVYDSAEDFQKKATYAQDQGLLGVSVYALSEDYLLNSSSQTPQYDFQKSLLYNGLGVGVPLAPVQGPQISSIDYGERSPNN